VGLYWAGLVVAILVVMGLLVRVLALLSAPADWRDDRSVSSYRVIIVERPRPPTKALDDSRPPVWELEPGPSGAEPRHGTRVDLLA